MRVAFRTDASLLIGTGHVMRCLSLADRIKKNGGTPHFICRVHEGDLTDFIQAKGFEVSRLPSASTIERSGQAKSDGQGSIYENWLATDWQTDAEQSLQLLRKLNAGWLVVDHYALDSRWERHLKESVQKIMVIDDLANREHDCELLLDQNLGRSRLDYAHLVSSQTQVMAGPQYALLRPEFALARTEKKARPFASGFGSVLISMGGVDQHNATGKILQALKRCFLPDLGYVRVVIGSRSPWMSELQETVSQMPWSVEILENVSNMAELMAQSDLAIGAAGGTCWEYCCLELPMILVVLAENQKEGASAIANAGAALVINSPEEISASLQSLLDKLTSGKLEEMSRAASNVTDGQGIFRVLEKMGISDE